MGWCALMHGELPRAPDTWIKEDALLIMGFIAPEARFN